MWLTQAIYPSLFLGAALSSVSARQLYADGGLSILSYNDLNNDPDLASAAILIDEPSRFSSAEKVCNRLGETVWAGGSQSFFAGLNSTLSYQLYQRNFPSDQLFWVDKRHGNAACTAVDFHGEFHRVACGQRLPTLCTQSAPVSNSSAMDNSAQFQVSQQVGQRQFIGYRDFFVWKFLGIRYAAQPERFTYSTVYDGTGRGSSVSAVTAQADCLQPIGEVTEGASEDCLFLNIWTPYLPPKTGTTKKKLKPVMLYIYGGGLSTGSGKNPNTDGTNLASRGDVVVVSLNYRLGNLGFLAFDDGVHNGNYGIGDMVTALEWIAKYIQYFGGDPERVTIFGESAGAVSVHALLASPKAQGLFQNAIMQSDVIGYTGIHYDDYMTIQASYTAYTTSVLDETGCSNATDPFHCLQNVNGTLLAQLPTMAIYPVIDGTYLTSHELDLSNSSGPAADVAVITGSNRNEAAILIPGVPDNTTLAEWEAAVLATTGLNLAPILASGVFDISDDPDTNEIFNVTEHIATDAAFRCLEQAKAYSAAKHHAFLRTYSYLFNRTYSPPGYTIDACNAPVTPERPYGDPDLEYYKCHAGEQLIMFGNIRRRLLPDRDGLDIPFMQLAVDYWSAFARTRNPNPDRGYLVARGYHNTLSQTEATGRWEPVDYANPTLRLLQWNGGQVAFSELEQCQVLAYPLDYYESH